MSRDDVPQVLGGEAEEVGGEAVVGLRKEAVISRGLVFPETVDGLPRFVDGEWRLL